MRAGAPRLIGLAHVARQLHRAIVPVAAADLLHIVERGRRSCRGRAAAAATRRDGHHVAEKLVDLEISAGEPGQEVLVVSEARRRSVAQLSYSRRDAHNTYVPYLVAAAQELFADAAGTPMDHAMQRIVAGTYA